MAEPNPIIISNLTGGLNNTDPACNIADDQCAQSDNVEWTGSAMGERRRGTSAVTVPAALSDNDNVWWLFRHTPTDDDADAELWALGVTDTTSYDLYRKTSSWSAVTLSDAWTMGSGDYPTSRFSAVSLHEKLFIAYPSAEDRLHVWDGTSVRRAGLAQPEDLITPSVDTGPPPPGFVGILTGIRYYRYRYTVQVGGVTILRSEPSNSIEVDCADLTTPIAIGVGRIGDTSEDATHWEVEASFDDVDYYVIWTGVVGTTTSGRESVQFNVGLGGTYDLSEDIGDYTTLPSAKILLADEDRLVLIGHWTDVEQQARMQWTPVFGASGVGNDERLELDTDPFLDLDTNDSGELAGAIKCFGDIFVFFSKRVYRIRRTGNRAAAYAIFEEKSFGAVPESIVIGTDAAGNECIYFFDPAKGPCRYDEQGVMTCGSDVRRSWKSIHLDASLPCVAYYYPKNRQVFFSIAIKEGPEAALPGEESVTGPATETEAPFIALVLHTQYTVDTPTGVRKGWSRWTGTRARPLSACLFADNIEDDTDRGRTLVPFIGTEEGGLDGLDLIHLCDTGTDDNDLVYVVQFTTKAFVPGGWIRKAGVMSGVIVAKPLTGSEIIVYAIRDFGFDAAIHSQVVGFSPTLNETEVIEQLDDLELSEARAIQFKFGDNAPNYTRWELTAFAAKLRWEESM